MFFPEESEEKENSEPETFYQLVTAQPTSQRHTLNEVERLKKMRRIILHVVNANHTDFHTNLNELCNPFILVYQLVKMDLASLYWVISTEGLTLDVGKADS